jgi:hypothetical protein
MSKPFSPSDLMTWRILLNAGPMTDWEKEFVNDVTKKHPLSEKQETVLRRIIKKYFPRMN